MDITVLQNAQDEFDFFETPSHHALKIYKDCNPKEKLNVLDICCGLGSLSKPWYDEGHYITLIEYNALFIPVLKKQFPKAKILHGDFLTMEIVDNYDIFLCNPPFNTSRKNVYKFFFCKILTLMMDYSLFFFICPKMFYREQHIINFNINDTKFYLDNFNTMPPSYFINKYNHIELDSNKLRFTKPMILDMIAMKIIDSTFIVNIENDWTIQQYYEIRYLNDVCDFKKTSCRCGLFKISK